MALNVKTADPAKGPAKGITPRFEGDNFTVPTGRGVLSAAEIEALLRPDIPEDAFETPEDVAPRPLQNLETASTPQGLELDAATLASRLTLCLRRACGIDAVVNVNTARNGPLSHLVSAHEGEPVLVLFQDHAGAQIAGLTLDSRLAAVIIDRSCGGAPNTSQAYLNRKLSALDKSILEEMLRPLAGAVDPSFSIACIETQRSAAHAMLPPGKAMLADLTCDIDGVSGKAAFARLEDAAAGVPGLPQTVRTTTFHDVPAAAAGKLTTQLTARIATLNVPISRLSDLKAGSVLLLGLPTDQPVELLSGGHRGQVVAEGDVGRKGDKIAVRITKRSVTL